MLEKDYSKSPICYKINSSGLRPPPLETEEELVNCPKDSK